MIADNTPFMLFAQEKANLSIRAMNILLREGVETFGDFMRFNPSTELRDCGIKTVNEILSVQKMYSTEQPSPEINWEQRRYEIAKTVVHSQITAPIIPGVDPNPSITDLAKRSVMIADAIIDELKKGGEK